MAEVRMPKMGDGMEEGTINSWLKREGEFVNAGDPIAEVETDKANVEISAYESGVLTRIVVPVGQTVPVGAVIAQIGASSGAEAGNGATSGPNTPTVGQPPSPTVGQASVPVPGPPPLPVQAAPPSAGNGVVPGAFHGVAPEAERVKASPLARRMMAELSVDAAQVRGTGPGGRIVERDVKAFLEEHPERTLLRPALAAEPTRPAASAAETPPVEAPAAAPTGQVVKPSKMRAAIARRTVQSVQNIPHFYVTMVNEMDRALALLKELNADATDSKVTVNDIIVKACAVALGKVPQANSSWTEEGILQHQAAHIGVAVSIEEGLVVPVIRDCQVKTLRQISADAKQLVAKARSNQLKPEEYSGGTFSTSNVGMMGVDEFTAIINPPEAAILAIGGIFREPVVVDDNDTVSIRSRMKVTLSADHRLLDGAVAARFLQEVKKALESPFSLLS